ncbi:hypothetical protein [Streptomyces sp. 6N223]|uniref:hypothetical protein n=1 Tax=Streptomyces sp. 6N223 TaxID=3457412 RepID=UPI003FD420D3
MRDFIRLPYSLYRQNLQWVAPLETERRRFLDSRHNPFLRRSKVAYFLAGRAGRVVGRIAALLNPDSPPGEREGYVGFFECANEPAAARGLFDHAVNWLRTYQVRTVMGPMNPNTHHECGLLVAGFDDAPLIGMPYNLPYYESLFITNGFTPVKDLLSWRIDPGSRAVGGISAFADGLRRQHDLTVRPFDWRRYGSEIALVRELYHSCWQDNWGFTPVGDEEFGHLAQQVRRAAPDGIRIAERQGEPVGFSVLLPDVNQALAPARGRLTRHGVPTGAWRLWRASRAITRGRLMALGVPQVRRTQGAAYVLIADALRHARDKRWSEVDVSWVLDDNDSANRPLAAMGASLHKRHRLYARCVHHVSSCRPLTTCTSHSQEDSHAIHS